jgi:hypothetical protein
MGIVPPRFIPPRYSTPVTVQEAIDALEAAFGTPWWGIWLDDGISSERYSFSVYYTLEEAQDVCSALQEAYQRLYYECRFLPSLRGKKPTTDKSAIPAIHTATICYPYLPFWTQTRPYDGQVIESKLILLYLYQISMSSIWPICYAISAMLQGIERYGRGFVFQ